MKLTIFILAIALVGVAAFLVAGKKRSPQLDVEAGGGRGDSLADRCKAYLQQGPPSHMTNYVSGSMLEIILAHGAKSQELDPELRQMGGLVLHDVRESVARQQDQAIRSYMQQGANLVKEVLER